MKQYENAYLPEAQNDRIFAFIDDCNKSYLIAFGVVFVAFVTLIILMIRERRKGGER